MALPKHQPDLPGGRAARDEGMERVLRHQWMLDMIEAVRKRIPVGWKGTGEDLRVKLTDEGWLRPPHHHNAWGAAVNMLIRVGLIVRLDVPDQQMKQKRSHARRTGVYVRIGRIRDIR